MILRWLKKTVQIRKVSVTWCMKSGDDFVRKFEIDYIILASKKWIGIWLSMELPWCNIKFSRDDGHFQLIYFLFYFHKTKSGTLDYVHVYNIEYMNIIWWRRDNFFSISSSRWHFWASFSASLGNFVGVSDFGSSSSFIFQIDKRKRTLIL